MFRIHQLIFFVLLIFNNQIYGLYNQYHHHHYGTPPYSSLFDQLIGHQQQNQHELIASAPTTPSHNTGEIFNNLRYFTTHIKHGGSVDGGRIKNGFNYKNEIQLSQLPPAPSQHSSSFPQLINLPPLTSHLDPIVDLTYILNGRVLKQYLVMENHDDDNSLDSFLQDPVNRNTYIPHLPHLNFNQRGLQDRPNLGFPNGISVQQQRQQQQQQQQQFQQLRQTNFRGPAIQLGSGSLGFVRHPNGAVYLGSGSLGYSDHQQRFDTIQGIQNRQSPEAGPLSFGGLPK